MGSEWKPDDRFLSEKGRAGIDHINDALAKHGFSTRRDRIFTSRDPKMDLVRYELRRENLPPGWTSWQLPTFLLENPPTFFFLQIAEPGAVLPEHSHPVDQIRIVLWGGLIYNGIELKAGDWMFIPKNTTYSLSASLNPGLGCAYAYG